MKALVVYDSVYGNTEKIAQSIGNALGSDVKVLRPGTVNPSELQSLDFLIIGSPTQGGRAVQSIQDFLNKIPEPTLKNVKLAVFDTRLTTKLVGIFGYAGGKIVNSLKAKGGSSILRPEGFYVKGSKGPLKEGELERAASWAKEITKSK